MTSNAVEIAEIHDPKPNNVPATGRGSALIPFQKGYDPRRGTGSPGVGGRPSSVVRAAARLAFHERIRVLMAIADGEPVPFKRRYKAKAGKRLPDGTICTKEQEEAGMMLEVEWEDSADLDQRMKAIQMLGQFGGLNSATVVDEGGEGGKSKPVYVITFD